MYMRCSSTFTVTGPLDPHRLRDAVRIVVERHPNLAARFCPRVRRAGADHPGRSRAGVALCRAARAGSVDIDEQIERICAEERAAVCDLADGPVFRAALIRTAENRHRLVLTNHHIVMDGWSLPILLSEIFASYYGQRLPAPAPYRSFVTWLADRDRRCRRSGLA